MPASSASAAHASRSIVRRITISPVAGKKLGPVLKSLGFRYNSYGRLLELCADLIAERAESLSMAGLKVKGFGRLLPDDVREIRRSRDKISVIALDHCISEAMVCKVRARKAYRWVR